jgi:hypothetical protein
MDSRRALSVVHRDQDLVLALSSSPCLIFYTGLLAQGEAFPHQGQHRRGVANNQALAYFSVKN